MLDALTYSWIHFYKGSLTLFTYIRHHKYNNVVVHTHVFSLEYHIRQDIQREAFAIRIINNCSWENFHDSSFF